MPSSRRTSSLALSSEPRQSATWRLRLGAGLLYGVAGAVDRAVDSGADVATGTLACLGQLVERSLQVLRRRVTVLGRRLAGGLGRGHSTTSFRCWRKDQSLGVSGPCHPHSCADRSVVLTEITAAGHGWPSGSRARSLASDGNGAERHPSNKVDTGMVARPRARRTRGRPAHLADGGTRRRGARRVALTRDDDCWDCDSPATPRSSSTSVMPIASRMRLWQPSCGAAASSPRETVDSSSLPGVQPCSGRSPARASNSLTTWTTG